MPDISPPTVSTAVPQKKPKMPRKPSILQRRARPRPTQAPAEISKIKMVQNPTASESIVGIKGFVIGQPIKIKKTPQKHLKIVENSPKAIEKEASSENPKRNWNFIIWILIIYKI